MKRWPYYVAGGLVVLVAGAALVMMWRADAAREGFEARVERLRAAGAPVKGIELERPYVPPERNATLQFMEAHQWLKRHAAAKGFGIHFVAVESPEKTAAFLATLEPYLRKLEAAATCDGSYAARHWADGPHNAECPEIAALQEMAMVLVALAKHHPTNAARCVTLLLDLSERVHVPFVMGDILRASVRRQTLDIVQSASAAPGFDARALRATVEPHIRIPKRGPSRAAMQAERVWIIWFGRHPQAMSELDEHYGFHNMPAFYEKIHAGLDVLDQAIARCGVTPEEAVETTFLNTGWGHGTLATNWFQSFGEDVASMRMLRVMLAVLEHRQIHGDWPAALPAGLPQDPFTRAPFKYERTTTGVRICARDPRYAGDWDELHERGLAYEFR